MEEKANVTISFREGKIEVSGSEGFVREQLDRFKDLIEKRLSIVSVVPQQEQLSGTITSPRLPEAITSLAKGENPYPNVIALDGDTIKILKVPGKDKAEKTMNLTLLYLLAKNFTEEKVASSKELREVCKEHACLDAANFSSILKRAKQHLIISGSRMKQSAKLTNPGLEKAKQLAEELNKQ